MPGKTKTQAAETQETTPSGWARSAARGLRFRKAFLGWGMGVFFASFAGMATAQAGVTLKNGNFFMGYVDAVYSGGLEPKIDRVYNSVSEYDGIFGKKWGSFYEGYLELRSGRDILVREYGGGVENRFVALPGKPEKASAGKQMPQKGIPAAASWKSPLDAPNGTQWVSSELNYQFITRLADGFLRTYESGKTERFNDQGRLVKIADRNGNYIELTYGPDGKKPQRIRDNLNRKLVLRYNARGLVEKIEGENGKTATYAYGKNGELESSSDFDENRYVFRHDSGGRGLLVEIGYKDKTRMLITYHGKDQSYAVKKVVDRDGGSTEYEYDFDPKKTGRTWVSVLKKEADGSLLSSSEYEYFVKKGSRGQDWNYKLVTRIDDEKTETLYDENFGLPVEIRRGERFARFRYDVKGRALEKATNREVTTLAYDPKVSLVKRVEIRPASGKKPSFWANYEYDARGNLTAAKDSRGRFVKVAYSAAGAVLGLRDHQGRYLSFKYGEGARVREVIDGKTKASLQVTYTNSGEVVPPQGASAVTRRIAADMSSAFRNLTEIVKPAGVELSL